MTFWFPQIKSCSLKFIVIIFWMKFHRTGQSWGLLLLLCMLLNFSWNFSRNFLKRFLTEFLIKLLTNFFDEYFWLNFSTKFLNFLDEILQNWAELGTAVVALHAFECGMMMLNASFAPFSRSFRSVWHFGWHGWLQSNKQ